MIAAEVIAVTTEVFFAVMPLHCCEYTDPIAAP